MKKISVIVPCYNVERYIERCFNSIKNQTYGMDNIEFIFVNDASTDGTYSKLLSIEKEYPENVIVINFEQNRKQGAARNVGMDYATGEYISFIDADDHIERCMYEKMIEMLEKYDCDFLQCRYDTDGDMEHYMVSKMWKRQWFDNLNDSKQLQEFICEKYGMVSVCDKIYRHSFLLENNISFVEDLRCEDIYFSNIVYMCATSAFCMNEIYYHYFLNPSSTMSQTTNLYQLDKMDVSIAFLSDCLNREFYVKKREEIEWLFLRSYYIYMLWEIFHRFPELSYEKYQEMRSNILDWIPDYKTNPYRYIEGYGFENIMLKILDRELNEEELNEFRSMMIAKIEIPV